MSPRDTLCVLQEPLENGHKNLGLRVGAQESPVHFQKKTIIQGEKRERGNGSYRAWKYTKVRRAEEREFPRYCW